MLFAVFSDLRLSMGIRKRVAVEVRVCYWKIVCLFVCYLWWPKARELSSSCLHFTPPAPPNSSDLGWFTEAWLCIVSDLLISNTAVVFSVVLYFFGYFNGFGEEEREML